MNKALLICLLTAILLMAGIIWLESLSNEMKVQGKESLSMQLDGIELNNTDYNDTFLQYVPDLGAINVTPRIIIEYGDYAIKQDLTSPPPLSLPPRIITEYADATFQLALQSPQGLNGTGVTPRIVIEYADAAFQLVLQSPRGLNTTGVTPRVMIEYADYASFLAFSVHPYPNPPNRTLFPLFIGQPFPPPPGEVLENQSVTVSVNVTGILSLVKSASLNYTTNGVAWNSINMTLVQQFPEPNSTVYFYQATIPGQLAGTRVNYSISAYDEAGNYAENNNNTGRYFVYNVVPEFPSVMLPILFVGATLSAVIAYRKRRKLS